MKKCHVCGFEDVHSFGFWLQMPNCHVCVECTRAILVWVDEKYRLKGFNKDIIDIKKKLKIWYNKEF